MIDEAIGKILGMVMAYGASALGMFVAYVNYRKRIVKADKVMTPAAWTVVVVSVLAILAGGWLVVQLATPGVETVVEAAAPEAPPASEPEGDPVPPTEESAWPLIGILVPASIFLFATVVTAALHRHFSSTEARS